MAAEVTPMPVIDAEVMTALTAFMLVNEAEPYPTVVPVKVVMVAEVAVKLVTVVLGKVRFDITALVTDKLVTVALVILAFVPVRVGMKALVTVALLIDALP